jgi:hypothetical protein
LCPITQKHHKWEEICGSASNYTKFNIGIEYNSETSVSRSASTREYLESVYTVGKTGITVLLLILH